MSKLFYEGMPSFGVLNNINRCSILAQIPNSKTVLMRIIELIEFDKDAGSKSIIATYSYIGEMIHLSEQLVRICIKKLDEAGIIKKAKYKFTGKNQITLTDFCLNRYWKSYTDFYKDDTRSDKKLTERSDNILSHRSDKKLTERSDNILSPNKEYLNKEKEINKEKEPSQEIEKSEFEKIIEDEMKGYMWESLQASKKIIIEDEKVQCDLPTCSSNIYRACEDTGKFYNVFEPSKPWQKESRQIQIRRMLKSHFVQMKQHHVDLSLQNLKLDLKGDDLGYVLDVCRGGKQKLFIQGSSNSLLTHLATGIFKQNLFEVHYPYEHSYGMPRISFMTWDECMQLMHDFYIEAKRTYSQISTIKDKFARFDMIIIDQFSVGKKNKLRETMIKQLDEFVQIFEGSIVLLSTEDQAPEGLIKITIGE
jgi:DNA-binding Lrp family transcriptional regulator